MKKSALIFILLVAFITGIYAQDNKTEGIKYPKLNGHSFTSLSAFRSPFIRTSFKSDISIGQTSKVQIPAIYIGDYEILTIEGKLIFANIAVHYKQRFNKRLAMYISLKLDARIGSDMSTILVDGLNTMTGGEIGWMVNIYKNNKFCISGSLGMRNLRGNFVNVAEYFSDIINNEPDPSVTKVIPSLTVSTGIHAAYAPSPTFGFQFISAYGYGESFSRGENESIYNLGLAGEVDFFPAHKVPVGITLAYMVSYLPEIILNYEGPSNMAVLMINYTGSNDFELALNYNFFDMVSTTMDNKVSVSNAGISFTYYF